MTKPKTERLSPAQKHALRMADKHHVSWSCDKKLRGAGDYGIVSLEPENETTYRTLCGLVDRGLMFACSKPDGDVAWALTPRGRYALQQIGGTAYVAGGM